MSAQAKQNTSSSSMPVRAPGESVEDLGKRVRAWVKQEPQVAQPLNREEK